MKVKRGQPAPLDIQAWRITPEGGYVAASVHCIQPDVPPENIVAMCEEVAVAGCYPLRV